MSALRSRILAVLGQPEAHMTVARRLGERGDGMAAVRHIAAAAQAGFPEAMTRLGQCYLSGQGVPRSAAEARHWLERAAEAGDVTALTELAGLALRGISGPYQRGLFTADEAVSPDHEHAASLARRAMEAGSAEAGALLAYVLTLDPSIAAYEREADILYEEAADMGSPLGQLGHAVALLRDGDAERASRLLTAAAESGLPTARFLLGAVAEAGLTGGADLPASVAHYRIAAEQGHSGAKTRLGLALLLGRGVDRDPLGAETWLRRAAMDNEVLAAASLGDLHCTGNQTEAARWYRRAAEQGHGGAAHALARVLAAGAEGPADPVDIANMLRKAIECGETSAWPALGRLIALSSPPDHATPGMGEWLGAMIAQGHGEAEFYAGLFANVTMGGDAVARRHYLLAAAHGMPEAMAASAEMLFNGRGGAADPELARAMFEFAAARDHAGASYALGMIAGPGAMGEAHIRRAAALGHEKAQGYEKARGHEKTRTIAVMESEAQ